jgi:RNA polymerase sigma factor (sigma-70 family)
MPRQKRQSERLPPLTPEQQVQAEKMLKIGNWVLKNNPAFRRRLGSLANSIMAEAVVLAVQCWDESKGSKLSGWVARCVRLTLCSAVGSDGVIRRPGGDDSGHPRIEVKKIPFGGAELPEPEVEKESLDPLKLDAIHRAMRELPPNYAEVLRLRFWQGLQLKNVGEKMGISKQRVNQLQVKALERLKAVLARQGILWAEEFATAHSCGCC